MQNIKIKGMKTSPDLDRKIRLTNGAIIIQREDDVVIGVFMVVSFRDNKNKYPGDSTTGYCTLIDLDTGKIAFEERCSRQTTERRVLRHLTFAKITPSYPYKQKITYDDNKFRHMRIDVYANGNYTFNLELGTAYTDSDEDDEIYVD